MSPTALTTRWALTASILAAMSLIQPGLPGIAAGPPDPCRPAGHGACPPGDCVPCQWPCTDTRPADCRCTHGQAPLAAPGHRQAQHGGSERTSAAPVLVLPAFPARSPGAATPLAGCPSQQHLLRATILLI